MIKGYEQKSKVPNNMEYKIVRRTFMLQYTMQPYDTLFGIANRFGYTEAQILAANPNVGKGGTVSAGEKIIIPGFRYEIQTGDTLNKIASKFNVPISLLTSANPQILFSKNITVGQKIFITSTLPPGSIPKQAKEIEADSREILNDIRSENWSEVNSKLAAIKKNFNELKPMIKPEAVTPNLFTVIENAMEELEKDAADKDVHESRVDAFIIYEYMQDILDIFRSPGQYVV
jgi:LysM repeat protein